ncbi:hypothetical protein [Natrarchaeobaculum sulfurireducens]|uniref:hypothetical protein n=1 Tax=Natrarchaeobaculum sulfurireducens TaxID=2044521 RepID=UPI00105AB061|nr:hypothetical protein [Natrarchaeobaculum sulfurireducens]
MGSLQPVHSVDRRTLEMACAIVTCLTAVTMVFEPSVVLDPVDVPDVVWIGGAVIAPGLLGLSVVIDAVGHLIRLGAGLVGIDGWHQPGDTAVTRIASSLLVGWLGASVLVFAVVTLSALAAPVGGVFFGPVITSLLGSVLGVLVFVHTLVSRQFPDSLVSRMRAPPLEQTLGT